MKKKNCSPRPVILHLFNDEKFVDGNIELMKKAGIPSVYVILTDKTALRFVSSGEVTVLSYKNLRDSCERIKKLIKANNVTHIGFHGFDRKGKLAECLKTVPGAIRPPKFIWFVFGYDLYNKWPPLRKRLYEPKTAQLLKKKSRGLKELILRFFEKDAVFKLGMRIPFEKILPSSRLRSLLESYFPRSYQSGIRKMEYAAPVLPNEMKFLHSINPRLKYLPFTYRSVLQNNFPEKPFTPPMPDQPVIIGNSGDPSNNHADIFYLLKNIPFHQRKIIVPLGYGFNSAYKEAVIRMGKNFFGEQFVPLVNFLPLDQYHRLLEQTHAAIYHHKRQQAVGNIIIMFYVGAKVFLHPDSPTYEYFKSQGLHIFSSLDIDEQKLHSPLPMKWKQHNRREILRLYGKQAVLDRIQKFEQILREDMILK